MKISKLLSKKIVYMFKTEKKLFNKIIFSLEDDLDIVKKNEFMSRSGVGRVGSFMLAITSMKTHGSQRVLLLVDFLLDDNRCCRSVNSRRPNVGSDIIVKIIGQSLPGYANHMYTSSPLVVTPFPTMLAVTLTVDLCTKKLNAIT